MATDVLMGESQEGVGLLEENQRLHMHTAALHDIAQVVVDEPDLRALVQRLSQKIGQILEADQVIIGIISTGKLQIDVVYELGRYEVVETAVSLREEILGRVLATQKPYRTNDITSAAALKPLLWDMLPCSTVLAYPILNHQNHPLGVIECRNLAPDARFTAEDQTLLRTIALQVASGIERAQMFHHLLRWNVSLQSLFAFNAALNEHLDPPLLVRRLVEHAAGFLGADAGLSSLTDGYNGLVSDAYWHDGRWHEVHFNWLADETIPSVVFQRQCPYLTNEYGQDRLAHPVLVHDFGVKNAVCVPFLDADETVLGFIEIHNKEHGREPFTWSDVSFLESLAHTMAVALRNARLMQELDKHRQDLQALSVKHINLLEEERTKISRELHDEAGQALIGIKLNLQLMERQIPAELGGLREQARELRQQVNQSTSQLRELARTLRTPALDELGLQAAVQQLVSQFSKQTTMAIHYHTLGLMQRLTRPTETVCYRIIQEALTNVVRHAEAAQVWIAITADESTVILSIRDDGCGFDTTKLTSGLGLVGIRERVGMLGGECRIVSQQEVGTQIEIRLQADQVLEPEANHPV